MFFKSEPTQHQTRDLRHLHISQNEKGTMETFGAWNWLTIFWKTWWSFLKMNESTHWEQVRDVLEWAALGGKWNVSLKDWCFIHSKSLTEYYAFYIKPVTSLCSHSQIKPLHHNAFISGPRTSKGCSRDFRVVFQTCTDTEVESDKLGRDVCCTLLHNFVKYITLFFINLNIDSFSWGQQSSEILLNLNLFLNLKFSCLHPEHWHDPNTNSAY